MDTSNRVLIITYYWPPSGGSGVQRWLKFVKYLPLFGWKPYVFTPENPSFPLRDESLRKDVPAEAEVIRYPIWEPYDAFLKLSAFFDGRKRVATATMVSGRSKTLFQRISTWVRGNLLVPDPRIFWVKPSAIFLNDFIRQHNITRVITTGPPHSMHLIGYALKMKNPGIRWFADFRDPWSEWGLLDSLMVGNRARMAHRMAERKVLLRCDGILTITPFYQRQFAALSGREVILLTNGFDEDDFRDLQLVRTEKFIIRHVGIVNEKCDPRPFMQALASLISDHPSFGRDARIDFVGDVHPQFRAFVEASPVLRAIASFTASVPHSELIPLYGSSSLLLLVLTGYKDAEGYMPGKLFEYLATGIPVLGVGPVAGDAAQLLQESGAGEMIDGSDTTGIRHALLREWTNWSQGRSVRRGAPHEKYSRRTATQRLVEMVLAPLRSSENC